MLSTAIHKGLNDVKRAYDHPRFQSISNENIRAAIDLADDYFADNGVEEYNRIRSRLFLEDMLLQYQKYHHQKLLNRISFIFPKKFFLKIFSIKLL